MDRLASLGSRYEMIKPLGAGGFGEVYLVRHRLLDALRVVKIPKGDLEQNKVLRELFFREARAANELHHPNIAQLFEFDLLPDSTPYLVMEYVEGFDPKTLLEARPLERVPLLLEIAEQVLEALGYLHAKGLVHRDISPDNIIVATGPGVRPVAKLIDLGIVKRVESRVQATFQTRGAFLGKPLYASPEQLRSQPVDGRSDLYSLGVVMYELATGSFPFPGEDLPSLVAAQISLPPASFAQTDPRGTLSTDLREVLLHALAKSPDDRFQNAQIFASRLRAARSLSQGTPQQTRIGLLLPVSQHPPQQTAGKATPAVDSQPEPKDASPNAVALTPAPAAHPGSGQKRRIRGIAAVAVPLLAIALALAAIRAWHRPFLGIQPLAPPTRGRAVLDARPWGIVEKIVGSNGKEIELPADRETPLLVDLPAGSFRVAISHPNGAAPQETTIQVEANKTAVFVVRIYPASGTEYLRAVGLR